MEQHPSDQEAKKAAEGDHSFEQISRETTIANLKAVQAAIVAKEVDVGIPVAELDKAIAEAGLVEVDGRVWTPAQLFQHEEARLVKAFTYHAPTPGQQVSLNRINQAAHALAHMILLEVPPCADRTAAIRLVREARMTANCGIVLDGAI